VRTPSGLLLRGDNSGAGKDQQREYEVTADLNNSVNVYPQML